jgi:hypothetical protein
LARRRFWYAAVICPSCQAGELAFVLAADGQTLVLFCCECDACYLDPAEVTAAAAVIPEPPEFRVAGVSVRFPEARWATAAEVNARGWASTSAAGTPTRLDRDDRRRCTSPPPDLVVGKPNGVLVGGQPWRE